VTTNANKLLLVTYHFPPATEVGGIRPAKFAKFLPQFGWKPYVLTIKEKYISSKDHDRSKDVGKVRIFRTPVWPTLLEIGAKITSEARWLLKNRSSNSKNTSPVHPIASQHENIHSEKLASRCKRYLISFGELPDQQIGWLIPAVWKGYWIIKKEGIKVILATAPPSTVAVVGLILSKLTRAKLITDLRDPWDLHDAKPLMIRSTLSVIIERWLERSITRNSNKIISITDHYRDTLRARYPGNSENTFCTISNGFDSNDFESRDRTTIERDVFVISYLGTFYMGRTPKELLKAIGELIKEEAIPRDKIQIKFIGAVRYAKGMLVEDLIKGNELSGCVELSAEIPYRESLAQMQRSDVLLVFVCPEQYNAIPAKTFEYLGAKRCILGLCAAKEGATADFIRETGSGIVVDPNDVEEIKAAIRQLYMFWKSRSRLTFNGSVELFERRYLTEKLVQIL